MRLLILISFLVFQLQTYSQAWVREKGGGYAQVSFTHLNYDQLLNGSKENIDLKRNIGDYTAQLYTEYGLSDNVDLIAILPYKIVTSSEQINEVQNDPYAEDTLTSGSLSGLSNPTIGLKYKIFEGSYVASASLNYQPGIHQYDDESGLQIGYDAHYFTPSLAMGRSWGKTYIQGVAGISVNTGEYANNFLGSAEYGWSLFSGKSWLMLRIDAKLPISEGKREEGNAVQTGLYRDNSSYISPGLKWIQGLGRNFYLNFGIYGAIYSEFEAAQATLNLGISYEWFGAKK